MTMSNNNGMGDTTLTKVFVGGLAWETPREAMKEHFDKYGEILEAVIISDKVTGRSKGYGFVTFKDAEAAKKACDDATPIINGRRANCNLAVLGARRPRSSSSTPPPPQQGVNVGPRATSTAPANHVQCYYPAGAPTPPMFYHHQHHQAFPVYGYSPTYIATDMNYNHKVGYTGGTYMNGHLSQVYPGQPMMSSNALMPMYPLHHFHHSHTMGLPARIYSPTVAGPIPTVPALMSKPTSIAAPNAGA
ncbi:probable RNA-binding protein ARP1 isoform X2 [Olea europaea var. sylvestris]|uniref:probable RNA-binding protein ARP1 isoform X2 n=1 Tax=Olea europaea var. sylvestris TaxID=158386 RepID=UPI000C1CD2B4|nr:probable RNA-binding protein ARP1 isoform X2 [Olea europaea var. sylvestris]